MTLALPSRVTLTEGERGREGGSVCVCEGGGGDVPALKDARAPLRGDAVRSVKLEFVGIDLTHLFAGVYLTHGYLFNSYGYLFKFMGIYSTHLSVTACPDHSRDYNTFEHV